jgi:[NiFe] hydrogenase diaphorase moiety small subunit
MSEITFYIDGKECTASQGDSIIDAARKNNVYIPSLCNVKELIPSGSCRICTVKVAGRYMAACTTPVSSGMVVESKTPDIEDKRKALVEMLFVEGNHMCPTCEKSGACDLQALGYKYLMMAPRFPYLWPNREIKANCGKIVVDKNRCVQCLRCVNGVVTKDGKHVFNLEGRGASTNVNVDASLAEKLNDEEAAKAMDNCPVGAILKKGVGFSVPIGKRKYDSAPIGSDIER